MSASALDDDTLFAVADLRARGQSWDATARQVGWKVPELRRAVRAHPDYDTHYDAAAREVRREVEAETLLVLREQLRDPDPKTARTAAEALAKHLAAERRDRTRLDVERLKADTARARLAAKREEPTTEPAPTPATDLPPDAVHTPALEDVYARRAANDKAVVWLWGGAHAVGGVAPDPRSDVPLVLFADDTVAGRGKVYWAARYPLSGDPFDGPFPVPQEEPPASLMPEQTEQLTALQAASRREAG